MSLFDGKSKDEKQAEKLQKMLEKYHLENMDPKFADSVKEIQSELVGTGALEAGMTLSLNDPTKSLPVYYLKTLIAQNWIIIRQLEEIRKSTEK